MPAMSSGWNAHGAQNHDPFAEPDGFRQAADRRSFERYRLNSAENSRRPTCVHARRLISTRLGH